MYGWKLEVACPPVTSRAPTGVDRLVRPTAVSKGILRELVLPLFQPNRELLGCVLFKTHLGLCSNPADTGRPIRAEQTEGSGKNSPTRADLLCFFFFPRSCWLSVARAVLLRATHRQRSRHHHDSSLPQCCFSASYLCLRLGLASSCSGLWVILLHSSLTPPRNDNRGPQLTDV